MQSLRTRRPSDGQRQKAAPRPQQKLSKSPSTAVAAAKQRTRSTRKSRVDDKIRKRMSMRYADISAPTLTGAGGIPSVPALPIGAYGGSGAGVGSTGGYGASTSGGYGYGYGGIDEEGVRDERQARQDVRETDLRALEQEEFDPDTFLKKKMANSTEAELKALQSSLQSYKNDTDADLQRNVFKNYVEFMMISKEVSTLENDLLELKASLSEWKSMPSLLHIDDTATVADRRRTQRSSVADLRVLYASQMQTLHAQIEGSSKFVPATPGRHIVTQMEGIYSLNPATYKVEHAVKFVLLDDAVLVARKRARRTADRPNLVAERCWPLNDILVLDTKDTATMTNVFKIRNNKETYVYRCDLSGDKKMLLAQFRQVAEELAARKRKEREGEHERRKTLWVGGGGDRRSFAFDVDATAAEWMNELALHSGLGGAQEKSDKDALWVGELTDNLTVAIALREWDKAVALVEEGEVKKSTTTLLESKLKMLRSSLTSSLLSAISDPSNRKSTVVHLTSLLLRLHAGPAARKAFLTSRAALTRQRVRMIRFEGHVQMYISDLATVVFTGIKHTADWFLASFKENDATSSFVEWAKTQISLYADMFRKQVFSSDVDEETVRECIATTHAQNKKLLQEFGLDFHFLLDELLVANPSKPDVAPTITVQEANETERRRAENHLPTPTPRRQRAVPPGYPAPPPRSRDRPLSIIQDGRF
ncbi:EXO84 [Sanghuangporus vaninii]